MIFEQEPKSGKLIALLYADDSTLVYDCIPSVCMNPVCECNDVFLKFERQGEVHNIGINIQERALIERENISIIDDFAIKLFNLLDESDFSILKNVYSWHKRFGSESADYSKLLIDFSNENIEQNGLMLIYNHVLPFANTFDVTIEGKRYALEENYCIKNKCLCTEAVLCFYPILNEDADEYIEAKLGELSYAIRIDYQSKTWVLDEDSPVNRINIIQTRTALENRYNNFYDIIQKHHQLLKMLYSNYLKSLRPEKSKKVGRNDPCPCGSRKKYKKCCESNSQLLA